MFQPLFGQLADFFGRKGPILLAVSIFVIGSSIAGAAPSIDVLIAGRVLQGLGGGGISVLCNVILCDMFPPKQRGSFQAVVMGSVSIGTAIGPFLGGGEYLHIALDDIQATLKTFALNSWNMGYQRGSG